MARYELLYVIPATYAETELKPVMDGVTAAIAKTGAKIARNDMIGKLKLAYPIKRTRFGYYVIVDLDLEKDKLKELDNALQLHSDVLRHALVIKNRKAKPVFKLASMEEIDRDRTRADISRESRARQAAAAPKPEGKKVEVNMEEIDQKLDKILEGKII